MRSRSPPVRQRCGGAGSTAVRSLTLQVDCLYFSCPRQNQQSQSASGWPGTSPNPAVKQGKRRAGAVKVQQSKDVVAAHQAALHSQLVQQLVQSDSSLHVNLHTGCPTQEACVAGSDSYATSQHHKLAR